VQDEIPQITATDVSSMARYSRVVRAQRQAEWERRQAEIEKTRIPDRPLDYQPILDELDRLRALRDP
jgi:hypothetical protein